MKFYRCHDGLIVKLDAIMAIEPDQTWNVPGGPTLTGYYLRVVGACQYQISLKDGAAIIELLERDGGLV